MNASVPAAVALTPLNRPFLAAVPPQSGASVNPQPEPAPPNRRYTGGAQSLPFGCSASTAGPPPTATGSVHQRAPTHLQMQLYTGAPAGSRMAPWQNKNPFVLYPLNNRIKKCAGCPFDFRDPNGPFFLGVVLQHKEKDFYTKGGMVYMSSEQNRYYHCELACIKPRHPYFSSSLVQIQPGLTLSEFQRVSLAEKLGLPHS